MEKIITKMITEHNAKKEAFMKKVITEQCNWWQKLWVRIAIKMKWRIWFVQCIVQCIVQQIPHELNSELLGFNFGTQEKFGIKINGKIHWYSELF